MLSSKVCVIIMAAIGLFIGYKVFDKILFPIIVNKRTKKVEVNPKWLTPKFQKEYYGFQDIDIILVEDPFNCVPRFRKTKENRYELLISNDTSIKDADDVAAMALLGKIKLKYGLFFPEKPLYWQSILCYMLDGGEIKQEDTKWENKEKDNKPID